MRTVHVVVLAVLAGCSFHLPGAGGNPAADAPPGSGDAAPDMAVTGQDGSTTCVAGVACDDQDACTEFDTCVGGTCTGVNTLCTGACSTSCSTCTTCCTEQCPNGNCPACMAGCSCDLDCGGQRPCNATCANDSECFVNTSDGDGSITVNCQAGSACAVRCRGEEGACTVTCNGDAACLMDCTMSTCNLTCVGTVVTCPNNIQVCNRACP